MFEATFLKYISVFLFCFVVFLMYCKSDKQLLNSCSARKLINVLHSCHSFVSLQPKEDFLYIVIGVHFVLYGFLIAREREKQKERERERGALWKTDTSVCLYSVRHCCELISWKIKRWDSNKSFVNFYNPQTHWSMGINEDAWYCCRYEQGRWWGQ